MPNHKNPKKKRLVRKAAKETVQNQGGSRRTGRIAARSAVQTLKAMEGKSSRGRATTKDSQMGYSFMGHVAGGLAADYAKKLGSSKNRTRKRLIGEIVGTGLASAGYFGNNGKKSKRNKRK